MEYHRSARVSSRAKVVAAWFLLWLAERELESGLGRVPVRGTGPDGGGAESTRKSGTGRWKDERDCLTKSWNGRRRKASKGWQGASE